MSHPKTETRRGTDRARIRAAQTGDDLHLQLRALQTAVTERQRQALNAPILTEGDFAGKLSEMKRACRETRFDIYLRSAAKHLHTYLQGIQRQETYDYWKARTLLYELNDVFNLSRDINEKALTDGQRILEELTSVRWDKGIEIDERKIIREKVLLCACRGNELKRQGETSSALSLFEWLLEFTNNKLRTAAFPCYSTKATLCYHIGTALRTLEQHRQAEIMFSEALDLLYTRGKKLGTSDYLSVTRKQAMIVGLGFGGINMTRGFLARAEHALTTARSMLASVNDPLVSSYVELLHATVQRCRAGSDKQKLKAVISQLQDTRRAFMDRPLYQARTCWELALAKILIGDTDGAQNDLRFVALHADKTFNPKWHVNVQILQSRICRKEGRIEEALAVAEAAVDKAKSPDCKTILPLVDAYITLGEARLSLAELTDSEREYLNARENFEAALKCILEQKLTEGRADYFSNPKIASVCSLRIAQCYARVGKQMNAKKHFAVWLRLEPHVEHGWVRELADDVKREIETLAIDFNISAADHQKWSYSENVAKLRRWLLVQSLRQTNQNYSEAAKLLGVQRTTLYQWQTQEAAGKRNRARTSEN